jgi:uncharacterized protein YjbI with pentapeptide repeats
VSARFDLSTGKVLDAIVNSFQYTQGIYVWLTLRPSSGKNAGSQAASVEDALREIARKYPKARLQHGSVKVALERGQATGSALKLVATQALYEAFGQPIPTPEDLAKAAKESRAAKKGAGAEIVAQLRKGKAAVRAFNDRPSAERSAAVLCKADLSDCDLTGIDFASADLTGADLSRARLTRAKFRDPLHGATLKGAKLTGADLSRAELALSKCREADFTGARLAHAQLQSAGLALARLGGADLTEADLTHADLKGADLTGAKLAGCRLYGADLRGADFSNTDLTGSEVDTAEFDEQTRWPSGFKPTDAMRWKGVGADPRLAPSRKEKSRPKPTDFTGFLGRLKSATDEAKLGKALSMLKADRFRLFARVKDDHLVGVVKSQSDPALVYSCRLGADGAYSCCTQNLNVCGGLRGSPCKHLLVLVVGLTKAGELDPGTAHEWTQASRGRKPALDRDLMTETLLQFKGAEAGEVDWRPTETIPEDFYAM